MSMSPFDLHNPTTVHAAIGLLDPADKENERVRLMAGGQDLLTEMKERIVTPREVVNLKHVPGLDRIVYSPRAGLRIGALATIQDIADHPAIKQHYSALSMAAGVVGSPQIRHIGTLGGNLCQRPRCWYYRNPHIKCLKKGGDTCYAAVGQNKYNAILGGGPSFIVHPSDTAPALVAFGAIAEITGSRGARDLPLERFFALPTVDPRRENVLKPDEILTAVRIPAEPLGASMRSVYLKFREKSSMDWAMSAVAVALAMEGRAVREARIVLGGVAPIPWRVPAAEARLKGREPAGAVLEHVADAALDGALPLEYNAYKVPLTRTLVKRAIRQAAGA